MIVEILALIDATNDKPEIILDKSIIWKSNLLPRVDDDFPLYHFITADEDEYFLCLSWTVTWITWGFDKRRKVMLPKLWLENEYQIERK